MPLHRLVPVECEKDRKSQNVLKNTDKQTKLTTFMNILFLTFIDKQMRRLYEACTEEDGSASISI